MSEAEHSFPLPGQIASLFERVREAGTELVLLDGRLALNPPGRCLPDLLAEIRDQREAITRALQCGAEDEPVPETNNAQSDSEQPELSPEQASVLLPCLNLNPQFKPRNTPNTRKGAELN